VKPWQKGDSNQVNTSTVVWRGRHTIHFNIYQIQPEEGKIWGAQLWVDVPSAETSCESYLKKNFETKIIKNKERVIRWMKENFLQQCLSPLAKLTDRRYPRDKKLSLIPSRMQYLRDTLQMAADLTAPSLCSQPLH